MHEKVPVIDSKATGEQIRMLRVERGISVKKISEALNLSSPQAVYRWERGETLPSIDNLNALAYILRVSMDDIIRDDRDNECDSKGGEDNVQTKLCY